MSLFKRLATVWGRVVSGQQFDRSDDDFVQLELELLEDRRLLSAGLTAILTGGILQISGGDESAEQVSIDVSPDELKIFDHGIEVSIGGDGGDRHALDLSELTDIEIDLGRGDDCLIVELANGLSLQVLGGDDHVILQAPASGTTGSLTIDAASIEIEAGTYASRDVDLNGEVQTSGDVDWTASSFSGHGLLELGGSLSLHADDTHGSLSWKGGIEDGGLAASLDADSWSDITLDGVSVAGGLELAASSVTLGGHYLASSVTIAADDLDVDPDATIEADSVELHPYSTSSTLHLGADDDGDGEGSIVIEAESVFSDGPLEVNGGLLTVNSAYDGDIVVGAGGTLGGNGTITGSVTVTAGGTLAPGNSPDTIYTGSLTLTSGANFDVEVTGPQTGDYDKVVVMGSVDVTGAILNLDDQWAGAAVTGDALVLIDNDGGDAVIGTFASLTNGAAVAFNGETWRIYYNGGDGNDVVLVFIPPAVMHVYVDLTYAGFTNGQIVDRDTSTVAFEQGVVGVDVFATITAGVAAVATGGTVHVAAGTYTYSGSLELTRAVTIDGAGMNATALRRIGAPTSNFDVALQIAGDNVTISDVRLGWTDSTTNDYMGYVVVVESLNQGVNPIIDNATITRVMFGEGYRSAIVMEGTDRLEVSDSIFEGNWGRAAIRDGSGGSGTNFLITRNEFREDHFRWGPISLGPQDNGDATNAYSGVISFNYFGNGLDPLNFQEQGDRNYTIAVTNNGLTAGGLVIDHNTFDWNDSNETNANGVYAKPAGVYIDPTVTTNTNLIRITDNIFNNFGYTGPQPGAEQPAWTTDSVFGTGALDFDGADDYATFMDPDFEVGQQGTLSFWVKMDNTGKRNQFFEGPGDGGMEFQYRTNSGGQFYGRMDAGLPGDFAIQSGGAGAVASNAWTNLQFTWNFATKQLHVYVNGVESYLAGSDSNIANWTDVVETANRLMYVGRDPGDNTRYFDGTMDDIGWFNRELSTAELAQIRNTSGPGVAALAGDASLVAHWDLDTTSGFTEADNKNGIVLTVHTSTPANDGPQLRPGMGVNGTGALEFDGIDDYATFQDASFDVGEQGTLSVWVKFNDLTSRNTLVEGTNSVGMEFAYRENSNGQFFGSPTRSTNDVAADNPNNLAISSGNAGQYTDQWVNVQYTWDRNGGVNPEMHIYINGTQVTYLSAAFDSAMQLWNDTLNTTTETMFVGRDSASTDRNFGGLMDDMAWYSEMLNQTRLDNVRLNGPGSDTMNLVAHWNFDDAVGTTDLAGDSGTSITLHLQSDPPPPPPPAIYGYGVFTPANTVVTNNVFYNDVPGSSYLDSNRPLDPSNITGPTANPLFNGDQPGYTGTTLAEFYTLRFGSSAAFESSEFQSDIATVTPNIGAYQGDPISLGTEDILIAGTDEDDLVVVTFTSENAGYFTFTRDVNGASPDYVGTFFFSDINSLTFDGYGGDDVLIVVQPDGALYSLPGGLNFNGGTQDGNGNALDSDGAAGGDTLVLLASTDRAVVDFANYVFGNATADGENGTITLTQGGFSTVITFTGVEPIRDELTVLDRAFSLTSTVGGGDETVTLESPGESIQMDAETYLGDEIKPAVGPVNFNSRLSSTLGPKVSFNASLASLAIDTGAGNDQIIVNSVDASFAAALSIDGGTENDSIILNVDLALGSAISSGDLAFSAETIDLGVHNISTNNGCGCGGDISLTGDNATIHGTLTTANGNIDINVANVDLDAALTTEGGSVTFWGVTDLTGDSEIDTETGNIQFVGEVTGTGSLTMTGQADIVNGDFSDVRFFSDVTTTGDIDISGVSSVSFGDVTGAASVIVTTVDFGVIIAVSLGLPGAEVGDVTLTAAEGIIGIDAGIASTGSVSIDSFQIQISGDIDVTAGAGDVTITSQTAFPTPLAEVHFVMLGGDILADTGNITLTGRINLDKGNVLDPVLLKTQGNVTITGFVDSNDFGGLGIVYTGLAIDAAGDVTINADLGTGAVAGSLRPLVSLEFASPPADIYASGTWNVGSGVTFPSEVHLTGNLSLTAAGDIDFQQAVDVDPAATGANLSVTSTGDVSSAAIDLSLGAARGAFVVTFDSDGDTVNTATFDAITAGLVTITSGGGCDDTLILNGPVDATLAVSLTGIGSLQINAAITTDGDTVTLEACDDITFGAAGAITTNGGNVEITADGNTDGNGEVFMADGAVIDAGAGNVTISASEDVTLGRVLGDFITIRTLAGAIVDGTTAETANIQGSTAVLRAGTGLGSGAGEAGGADLDLAVSNLAAASGEGDINLQNTGDLTIGDFGGLAGVALLNTDLASQAADVTVRTAGNLLVQQAILNQDGGDIILAAETTANAALTIRANVTATGGDGNVALFAVQDLTVENSAVVSAVGNGTILLSAGQDFGGGTVVDGHADADILLADGTQVSGAAGTVTLRATEDVALSSVIATNLISVTAGVGGTTGEITDNTLAETANLVSASVVLRAADGIGNFIDGTPANEARSIDINAGTLAATTITGDIVLCDEAGGLTIDSVAGTDGVTVTGAAGGQIVIEVEGAGNPLVVNSRISTAGTSAAATIDLSATGITLATATADITAVAGEITFDANLGQFASVAGVVVTSPAIVRISADSIDLQGTVHSDSEVRVAADTPSTAINLGTGANGAGGFALDEVELNNIESPIVRIGTAGTDTVERCDGTSVPLWAGPTEGAITFTGAFASDGLFGTEFLELFTRSSVTATAGGVNLSAAPTNLVIRAGADVNFAHDAHDLHTVAVATNNNAGGTLTNSAITLRDTAGMTLGTVDGLSGLTTAGGAISATTLGAAADLQVQQAVSNTGANAISLEAGRDIDFTANGDVTTQGGPVTVTADAFSPAGTGGAITMADGAVIRGTTANVSLTADGDIRLGQILTGKTTGNVSVTTTSGAILDNTAAEAAANDAANANIVGNAVALAAATGIGSGTATLDDTADLDLDAESLSAVNTLSGAIQIFETDSVALRDLSQTDTVSNVGRTIIIDAGAAISDFTPGTDTQANITGGAVTLRATTGIGSADDLDTEISQLTATNTVSGNIQVSEINLPGSNGLELLAIDNKLGNVVIQTLDGPLTVSGPVGTTGAGAIDLTAGDLDASGGENFLVDGALSTINGNITLTADGGDIDFAAAGDVTTTSGNISVTASGAVDQQTGSIVDAGSGQITILGDGNVTLARIQTTNSTDDAVSVTSTAGAIRHATGSVENIDAAAGRVVLSAANGIGTMASPLTVDAGRLQATNTTTGDVEIDETNAVLIEEISQTGPGTIDLSAGGTITLAGTATVQSSGGAISIQAIQPGSAINMLDGSLIDAGAGRITIHAAGDISISRVRTVGNTVEVNSTAGAIVDSDTSGGIDIEAQNLSLRAVTGIGNGNPLEINVANLAAATQVGDLQLTNVSGALLTVTDVANADASITSGLTSDDPFSGDIVLEHNGDLLVNSPIIASAPFNMGVNDKTVRLSTTAAAAGSITIASPIDAPNAALQVAATGDVAFLDAGAATDVFARTIVVDVPAGRTITMAPGTEIRSSTGHVIDVQPLLDNFTADQVTALGVASINFDYGRLPAFPQEQSFTIVILWGDGTLESFSRQGGGLPANETFQHTYTGNPDAGNPAAPIPVQVTILNDTNITFRVAGQEIVNTQTRTNAVPGDGLQSAIVYDLAIIVPELETPRSLVTDSLQNGVQTLAQVTTTVELAVALDAKATVEGRILIVHQIGPDGKPLMDAEGNPLQMVFTQEETQLFLGNLAQLYRQLNSGKFRVYLQEGDGRPLLVSVVTLRSGVPVTGNEATLDRPPTADADLGEMGGENGKDPDLDGPVPPPPPLPTMSRADKDGESLVRGGQPSRGFLAMVGHYLKNLGLM